MKHLKIYEDDKLFKDLKDLDLAEELYGWWVTVIVGGYITYYVIYNTSKQAAIWHLANALTGYEKGEGEYYNRDVETSQNFYNLESALYDAMEDGDTLNITSLEMTPASKDIKNKICKEVNHSYSIPHIHKVGKKYFSDFDQKMNANLTGGSE